MTTSLSTGQAARTDAIRRARAILSGPCAIFDTETTGLSGRQDRLVQIGVLDEAGSVLFDTLVNPGVPISYFASRVHGIYDRHVRNAPSFPDVYPELCAVMNDRRWLAYNLEFDRPFFVFEPQRYGLDPLRAADLPEPSGRRTVDHHCAMKLYAQYHGEWNANKRGFRWHKLGVACQHMGVTVKDAHSAIGDCRMTWALIRAIADQPLTDE